MKICLLTRSHQLKDSRIHGRIGFSLIGSGIKVIIICRVPMNSPRIFTKIDNIQYSAIPRSKLPKRDFIPTIQIFCEAWKANADVYVCFELRTLIMGLILKIFRGVKIVYDCHEYRPEKYSEIFIKSMREHMIYFLRTIERFLSKFCDSIWCVNEHLSQRFKYKDQLPVILPNYPNKNLFIDTPPLPGKVSSKYVKRKVICYVGGITEKRGITACLYTMFFLKFFEPRAFFLIIGAVTTNYKRKINYIIKKLSLSNYVEFTGRIPHNLIPSHLMLGQLGIFLVQPTNRRYNWGEPIKYFEYTAAGLPVIMSDLPAKRRLIESYSNGILVNPKNYRETALKITQLLHDDGLRKKMSNKGIHAFENELNWQNVETKMIDSIRDLSE